MLLGRAVDERAYRAQGLQLVNGCNGGAAVGADGEVRNIEQHLEMLSEERDANTNIIAQLQIAHAIAKEKARVLSKDCGRRSHRENHPWSTNWVIITQVLKASKAELFK